MNALKKLLLVAAAVLATNAALAQIGNIACRVYNGNYEQSVFGVIANSAATVTPSNSPTSYSQTPPASLSANQSFLWGYDSQSGVPQYGNSNAFNLKNASFRNVIRGANNNFGTATSIYASVFVTGLSSIGVQVLGPNIGGGVTGATSFSWTVFVNGTQYGSAISGESAISVPIGTSTAVIEVYISTASANELGSVMANFNS